MQLRTLQQKKHNIHGRLKTTKKWQRYPWTTTWWDTL